MIAFGLVAASIFMHSLWHFLCKSSGKPSMAFFALFSTSLAYLMAGALPVSALLGYLILKEKISAVRWLGLALIMAGLVLSVFFRSGLIIKGISIYSRIN